MLSCNSYKNENASFHSRNVRKCQFGYKEIISDEFKFSSMMFIKVHIMKHQKQVKHPILKVRLNKFRNNY